MELYHSLPASLPAVGPALVALQAAYIVTFFRFVHPELRALADEPRELRESFLWLLFSSCIYAWGLGLVLGAAVANQLARS